MTHLFQFCRGFLGREQGGEHAQVLKVLPTVTFWEMNNNITCEKLGTLEVALTTEEQKCQPQS